MNDVGALENFFEQTVAKSVDVSASGRWLAYGFSQPDAASDRWERSLAVTRNGPDEESNDLVVGNAATPKWSPTGERIGFVSAGPVTDAGDVDPEATEHRQVWVLDPTDGTPPRRVTDLPMGVRDFDWGPAGNRVVVEGPDPSERERRRLESPDYAPVVTERTQHKHVLHRGPEVTHRLFVVDVDSGGRRRLDGACGRGAYHSMYGMEPAWSPSGDYVSFHGVRDAESDDPAIRDVFVISPGGGDPSKVTGSNLRTYASCWNPSGTRLAFAGEDPEDKYGLNDLYVASQPTMDVENVSADFDRSVGSWLFRDVKLAWTDDETILGAVGDRGRSRLVRFDASGSLPERTFEAQSPYQTVRDLAAGGDTLGLSISAYDSGTDVYVVSADDLDASTHDDPPRRTTDLNAALRESMTPPNARKISYESRDGTPVDGFLYYPGDVDFDDLEEYPTIVSLHSGVLGYEVPKFEFRNFYWTNEGYAVFSPNFRGSASYGREFAEDVFANWGTAEADDVLAGVDELRSAGVVDPNRLFVFGFSRGGIVTSYLISQSEKFVAAAPHCGTFDFSAAHGEVAAPFRVWHDREFGYPWETTETHASISSFDDVDQVSTPTLVSACGRDVGASLSQSERYYTALKKVGVDAKLVVYPRASHFLSTPSLEIHHLGVVTDWFREHDPRDEATGTWELLPDLG